MTWLDALVAADVQVPSLLTRIITLTRWAGMSAGDDDLKMSLEQKLRSSGGGVNDDDFSIKLIESRAYIRFRGGRSDSSSVSDGFGVTKPLGSSNSFSLRFSECISSDFCEGKKWEIDEICRAWVAEKLKANCRV